MEKRDAVCNTCTIKLVAIAYRRAPLFRLVREPLKLGMRFLGLVYRIDTSIYAVRTPACCGCVRFLKAALKERSGLFRFESVILGIVEGLSEFLPISSLPSSP